MSSRDWEETYSAVKVFYQFLCLLMHLVMTLTYQDYAIRMDTRPYFYRKPLSNLTLFNE